MDEDSDFWYIVPRYTTASSMSVAQIIGCTMEMVIPETVCQYTGSLTSDIKKIFTNDIVENDGAIGVVKFGKYGNGFHTGYYIQWINSEFWQELGFWEGRLIDADALEKDIRKRMANYQAEREIFESINDLQPTAFDVDNVIKRLRHIQIKSNSSEFDFGIDKAIEVIKFELDRH